jgi:hypothetical protein
VPRSIYVLVWTPGKSDVVPTKKEGLERMKAWKAEREARVGWTVHKARGIDGFIAEHDGIKREAIVLHTYDPVTKQRIYPKLPPALTEEELRARLEDEHKEKPPKKRKGRKPIGA